MELVCRSRVSGPLSDTRRGDVYVEVPEHVCAAPEQELTVWKLVTVAVA